MIKAFSLRHPLGPPKTFTNSNCRFGIIVFYVFCLSRLYALVLPVAVSHHKAPESTRASYSQNEKTPPKRERLFFMFLSIKRVLYLYTLPTVRAFCLYRGRAESPVAVNFIPGGRKFYRHWP